MVMLHHVFSSMAKIKVLRTLYDQSQGMSLRQVAFVSELPVYSAQRALQQLLDENWLTKKPVKNRIYFSLNTGHNSYSFLHAVFDLEKNTKVQERSASYTERAQSALEFADSSLTFFAEMP